MSRKTVEQLLREARSRFERLEPEEALVAQAQGALLVDLRSHDARARHGVIPGSLHIPRSVLEWRLDPASGYRNPVACDLEREVVVFCADGYSSSLAAANLHELGFARATDIVGGFTAWKAHGLPTQPALESTRDDLPGMGVPDVDPSSGPIAGIETNV